MSSAPPPPPPLLLNHQPYTTLPDPFALHNRAAHMADGGDAAGALPLYQQVLVLAQAAHSHAPTPQTTLDVVFAMWQLSATKRNVGDLPGAQAVLQQAVTLAEQPPVGPAHPRLAQALRDLGRVLMQRGRFDEADATMQRALTMQEQLLGPNHDEVSQTLSHMGVSCIKQGNFRRAKGLLKRAVAIAELHVVPNQYPDKLSVALGYLADVYYHLEDYALAQSIAEQALALDEQFLGLHHPNVAAGLSTLVACLEGQGKLSEAVPLQQRGLAICERVYGPKHPNVAVALGNLSVLYLNLGDLARAKSVQERALAIREQAFGPQHIDVASSLHGLANTAMQAGDLAHAKALYERALSIYQTQLGRTHPETVGILKCLANLGNWSTTPSRRPHRTCRHRRRGRHAPAVWMVWHDGRARVEKVRAVPGGVVLQRGVPAQGVERAQASLPQEAVGAQAQGGCVVGWRRCGLGCPINKGVRGFRCREVESNVLVATLG